MGTAVGGTDEEQRSILVVCSRAYWYIIAIYTVFNTTKSGPIELLRSRESEFSFVCKQIVVANLGRWGFFKKAARP